MADGKMPNGKSGGEDDNKDVAKAAGFVVFSGIALSLIKALCPKKSIEEFAQSDDAVSATSTGHTVGELKEDAKEKTIEVQKEEKTSEVQKEEKTSEVQKEEKTNEFQKEEKTSEVQKEEKISEVKKEVIGFGSEISKKFQKQGTSKKSRTTIELIKGDTLWDLSRKYGQKSEAFETFKKFRVMIENQAQSQIGILRRDNGGEFTSLIFEDYLCQNGIQHHLTIPSPLQQNGVVEIMNRTIMNMVQAMLYFKGVKLHFWAEAARTIVYLRNRSPSFALHQATPYEVWFRLIQSKLQMGLLMT